MPVMTPANPEPATPSSNPLDEGYLRQYRDLFVHDFDRHGLQRVRNGKTWYRNNLPGAIGLREIRATLAGERTYAGYPVDRDGLSKWTLFDLDLPRVLRDEIENTSDPEFKARQEKHAWSVIYEMGRLLKNKLQHLLGIAPVTLNSGSKGLHLYVLWDKPITVKQAADFGTLLKYLLDVDHRDDGFEFLSVETYPCDSDVTASEADRLPHLVKLPLARHLKTDRIACFNNLRTQEDLPPEVLWDIERASTEDQEQLLSEHADELAEASRSGQGAPGSTSTSATHHADPFTRLNRPGGAQQLLEGCEALGGLAKRAAEEHHLEHRARFHLACSLLAFGRGEGEAALHAILESCSDYSFDYTQNQLHHALLRDYRPPRCQTLQRDGICPYPEGDRCVAVGRFNTPLGVLSWQREPVNNCTRHRVREVAVDPLPDSSLEVQLPTPTISEIRAEIPEQIDDYLKDAEGRLLVMNVDPGIGKTTTVGHHLANLGLGEEPFRIFWAAQRHNMFKTIFPLFFNIGEIEPKISDRIDPNTKLPAQRCINQGLVPYLKLMRKKEWSRLESRRVCSWCQFYKEKRCPYFNQWKYPGHIFAPQQHLISQRIQENMLKFQTILIDESPSSVFTHQLEVTIPMIDQIIQFIDSQQLQRGSRVIELLEAMKRVMRQTKANRWGSDFFLQVERVLAGNPIDCEQEEFFADGPKEPSNRSLHAILREINQSHFWGYWKLAFLSTSIEEMPHRWFDALFALIEKEKLLFGVPYTSRLFIRAEHEESEGVGPTMVITEALTFEDLSTPIIVLDGTPNLHEYERIFGREIVLYERHVRLQNKVYQLRSGEYTKSTLRGSSQRNKATRDRLLRIVAAIVQRGTCTLVAGTKEIIEQFVGPYLENQFSQEQYKLAYYWGFRGTNDFESCDQVVLLGAANPNFEELIHQHSGSFKEGDLIDPTLDAIWQRYEGLNLEVKVSGYADPRLNELLLFHRNHEMGQMIHRIRPLQDASKTIWILSDIPIPGIPPTYLMTVAEMTGHLRMINPSPRSQGALGHLVKAATELLEDPGWFTRKTLAEASHFAVRTVTKHLADVREVLGLTKVGHKYQRHASGPVDEQDA